MRDNELKAPIFNIVHGSMVDGWGVRTTIFLKGCPLRCLWCCNPEGQKTCYELKYTAEDCSKECTSCIKSCTKGAISFPDVNMAPVIDRNLCDNCFACVDQCPTGALSVFGKSYTVDEMFQEIAKDQNYFGFDGGVTIGGGEATLFGEYTLALIKKCQDAYIHTALDTCGYILTEEGLECLERADLTLFDIKGMDEALHIEATGVSNKIIHENLIRRNKTGKDIIIRLPIIPGYTDSTENILRTAEFLAPLEAVKRVDVLMMHRYSELKYRQLGWKIPEVFDKSLADEKETEIMDIMKRYGLNAQLGG